MDQQTIIFLGLQGSGKGTQIELLRDLFKGRDIARPCVLFDAGAHFRTFVAEEGYTQGLVRESIAKGELQPSFLSSFLMSKVFINELRGNEHLLVDGFPRHELQAGILDSALKFYKRKNPTVLFLDVSEKTAMARMLKRGRNDDTEEGIQRRFRWSQEIVIPLVTSYRGREGYRVVDINGDQEPDEVHREIVEKLVL